MPVSAPASGIESDLTYYVQNEHRGPATFNYGDAMRGQQFKWEGKGHPNGNGIQGIPGYVVKDPLFQRAMMKGLFTLVDSDDVPTHGSGMAWGDQETAFGNEALAQMDRPKENELVELHCIVPMKGGETCGDILFKRRSNIPNDPPLCTQHEKYADRFQWNGTEWQRAQ
jgi:hypothetical protein